MDRKEGLTNARIREVFLANGFTVKEGQTDLKPYVYAAARALLSVAALASQGEAPPPSVPARTTGYVAPKGRYVPPVLFSPYTGEPRDARDIQSDPQGILIVPPGADLLAAAPPPWVPATAAARDVLAERQRQVSGEGWTPEHDDEHSGGELAQAAATYAFPDIWNILGAHAWPFDGGPKLRGERENLVRAGALILAEIERLDRAAGAGPGAMRSDGPGFDAAGLPIAGEGPER